MTHSDIYTKFMIEYDKANVTSSYPSLTDYEIATLLDKAYLAIIAQKLTGNNQRRMPFEGDVKAIEDIRGLIKTENIFIDDSVRLLATNEFAYELPTDFLYFVSGLVDMVPDSDHTADRNDHIQQPVMLLDHNHAQRFKASVTNLPWIPNPVVYMEGNHIRLLYDAYRFIQKQGSFTLYVTYIKKPVTFVDNNKNVPFELSDSVAEEIINQAIIFAAETVESPRLQTKSNILSLES